MSGLMYFCVPCAQKREINMTLLPRVQYRKCYDCNIDIGEGVAPYVVMWKHEVKGTPEYQKTQISKSYKCPTHGPTVRYPNLYEDIDDNTLECYNCKWSPND